MNNGIMLTMNLNSLGLRTDLMLRSFENRIEHKPDHAVVCTPGNPNRWGNYLVFGLPPEPGDLQRWKALARAELGELSHFAFAWDDVNGERGAAEEFVDAGFRLQETVVQTASRVQPPRSLNTACQCRAFDADRDWCQWLDLALAQNAALPDDEREGADYKEFLERKVAEYRRMIAAGWGQWFGAFAGSPAGARLAASMGLFVRDGLGRFQSVDTHPDFRRHGLADTLLHHVARWGLTQRAARDLVILADRHYFANDLYAAVGFRPTEHLVSLEWGR